MFKIWKLVGHLIIQYSPFVEIHRTWSYKMQFTIDIIAHVAQSFVKWSLGSGISPPFHIQDMRAASKLGYSTAIAFVFDHFYVRFCSEGCFDISVGSQYRILTCVSYIWCPFLINSDRTICWHCWRNLEGCKCMSSCRASAILCNALTQVPKPSSAKFSNSEYTYFASESPFMCISLFIKHKELIVHLVLGGISPHSP